MLHNDRELFEDLVLRASEALEIEAAIIEKDYYVSLLLKEIRALVPEIVFKGGTSLSKCYHLIDRFSEDIDLSIFEERKPTEGQRRSLKNHIITAIENVGFELDNREAIRSRRDFNRFEIAYPSVFEAAAINQKLIVETAVFIGAYPTEEVKAGNDLYDYLTENDLTKAVDITDIEPFYVKTQRPERTFIDKVFALGDYYLDRDYNEHSRHIYDIYKLLNIVPLDAKLKDLIEQVREERRGHKTCFSAQEGVDINRLLLEILETKAFQSDYNNRTYYLLFKDKVPYEDACSALRIIADSKIF